MGRIRTSHIYVIDITRSDPLSLGEFGGISKALVNLAFLDVLGR